MLMACHHLSISVLSETPQGLHKDPISDDQCLGHMFTIPSITKVVSPAINVQFQDIYTEVCFRLNYHLVKHTASKAEGRGSFEVPSSLSDFAPRLLQPPQQPGHGLGLLQGERRAHEESKSRAEFTYTDI